MLSFQKPVVVISKCIEFAYCRWNGYTISSDIVKILSNYVEFKPVCPEVEIGLGVPRDPVRLVLENDVLKMIQPKTECDCTDAIFTFADQYFSSLEHVDGFILKSHSPSCGLFQTKYYHSSKNGGLKLQTGPGLFGQAVLNRYPTKAIETEGRLTNFKLREHWLIKLYTLTDFRTLKTNPIKSELIDFQTKNKLIFMAYNQKLMREMGKIVANSRKLRFEEYMEKYEQLLNVLLQYPPKYTAHVNVLMHAFGYFKAKLSDAEKAFFLDQLELYRTGGIPLFDLQYLLNSWVIRFDEEYLKTQSYFNLYPEELMNFDSKDTERGDLTGNSVNFKL
jgi:uncharacterized protein YbgA (DUF1722 family)/uncharacterized protein YbbK (DUF523 family)